MFVRGQLVLNPSGACFPESQRRDRTENPPHSCHLQYTYEKGHRSGVPVGKCGEDEKGQK